MSSKLELIDELKLKISSFSIKYNNFINIIDVDKNNDIINKIKIILKKVKIISKKINVSVEETESICFNSLFMYIKHIDNHILVLDEIINEYLYKF